MHHASRIAAVCPSARDGEPSSVTLGLLMCPRVRLRSVSRAVSCSFPVRLHSRPTGRIGVAVTLKKLGFVYAVRAPVQVRGL